MCLTLLQPHGLLARQVLLSMGFPGKNTGVGCHFLFQGIFPTQGSILCLLHCRWSSALQADSLSLSHQGSPVCTYTIIMWKLCVYMSVVIDQLYYSLLCVEFLILKSPYIQTEKAMAPHSSTLAWKIPWTEEPGRLQSMGSLRVRHDWVTSLSLFTFMHWRKKWQPTPVFLPGESQGQRRLVGCHLWGHTELDTTEAT